MESISPFLEKCENFCLLIEKYGYQVTISQMGEKVLGDYLISLSSSLVLMVMCGDCGEGESRGNETNS